MSHDLVGPKIPEVGSSWVVVAADGAVEVSAAIVSVAACWGSAGTKIMPSPPELTFAFDHAFSALTI